MLLLFLHYTITYWGAFAIVVWDIMSRLRCTYNICNYTCNSYKFARNTSLRESVGDSDLLRVSGLFEMIFEELGLRFRSSNLAS